ncbi:SDR family NAD(P)-dependent oxidoreductase [Paenibacillus hexagrammi]|uniref:SDR family NAD(P)-dependent oxidoreductase n=1 Tax=Paenibacillus hexagrammi TaxID=2908839 RepID=A0ABY3SF20_9BACL|nr:SDR family NAD(P)-dependent oxidoreductase [Paenibacillus sp. YPD9-1]UJF31786.1 SDR family NAD(P)-dependent oxidoreductase [Paenibacillus sp. YPD9-1]
MSQAAVVMGADDAFGSSLCRQLLSEGWIVFGGSMGRSSFLIESIVHDYPGNFHLLFIDPGSIQSFQVAVEQVASKVRHVDLLVSNIREAEQADSLEDLNFDEALRSYDIHALGPIRYIEAFLPLTDVQDGLKRLVFVSDEAGSMAMKRNGGSIGSSMAMTGLHMAIMIMCNHLSKEGYTFRIYVPSSVPSRLGDGAGPTKGNKQLALRAYELFTASRDDESRLTIHGSMGEEWPF